MLTVTNRDLLFRTLDDYRAVNTAQLGLDLLLEPFGRNTAAAIAVAALHVQEFFGGDAQLLVMPADHLILDESAFAQAVAQARELAEAGYLVTFGIQPDRPETGFGYIEQGSALAQGFRVQRFVEKTRPGHRPRLPGRRQAPVECRDVLLQGRHRARRAGDPRASRARRRQSRAGAQHQPAEQQQPPARTEPARLWHRAGHLHRRGPDGEIRPGRRGAL